MEYLKINSAVDGLALDVIISMPKAPWGLVQIVHGMGEYKERYLDFIDYLNTQGLGVIIHDQRGHGQSLLQVEDLGYFYCDYQALIEDTYLLSKYLKDRYPNLPFYLFGHSMGSLVVRNYLYRYDEVIDGLIVCGSPSNIKLAKVGRLVVAMMIKLKGERYQSTLCQKLSFGLYNRKYQIANEWICSDEKVVAKYNQDPQCVFTYSLNGYLAILNLIINTYEKKDYQANSSLPVLFISGEDDPCLGNLKAFNQAVRHLQQNYPHTQAKVFKGMRHEVLNEIKYPEVYATILDFLKRRES